jgi:hypothetical protein
LSVNATATFSGSSAVRLRLVATQTAATQTTVTVNYTLTIERPSGSGFYALSGSGNSWGITTGTPTNGSGNNFTYDFRSPTNTRVFQIASINRTINVSGPTTRQIGASASQPQAGGIGSASITNQTLTLTPTAPPTPAPSWTTTSFSGTARVGSTVSDTFSASNTTSYALASGSLPTGLSLSSAGVVSGTVSAGTSQNFNFTIRATGAGGSTNSATFTYSRLQPLPVWTDNTLSTTNLRVGTPYSDSVTASNASEYSATSLTGTGLSFNTTTRVVSGTPTSTSSFSFSITAKNTDLDGITANYTFTPKPPLPVFTDSTLATTTVKANSSYVDGVVATSATSYSISSGALPPGILLDTNTGEIDGVPTTVGTYTFRVTASNSISETVQTGNLTITVEPAGSGKVWNGTAWVLAPFKVWNGTAWVEAPAKVWNGSAWANPVS